MLRDWNLIRDILTAAEVRDDALNNPVRQDEFPGYAGSVVYEHMRMLTTAGYIQGKLTWLPEWNSGVGLVTGLTMQGYDALDTLRGKAIENVRSFARTRQG